MRLVPRWRRWLTVSLAAVAVVGLAGGILAQEVMAPETVYDHLRTFAEVLSLIRENYVEAVNEKDLVYGAIKGLLGTLDPHSSFMSPEAYRELQVETQGEFGGLGIEITVRDGVLTVIAPIEGTPADRAGVLSGDQILKVDGEPTRDVTLSDVVKKLRGIRGTKVTITIRRKGWEEPRDFTLVRDIIQVKSVIHRMVEGGIAHIRIRNFHQNTRNELESGLGDLEKKGLRGLILDLRNNPGGLLRQAVEVADLFLDEGALIVYTEGRLKNQNMRFHTHRRGVHLGFPMVVLVNSGSASASEIVAGALQDLGRAVILGTKTFGKASVQTIVPLSDGSGLRLTTALYYTPKGRLIQGKGIVPDIAVEDPLPPAPSPQAQRERRLQGEGLEGIEGPSPPEREDRPEAEGRPSPPRGEDRQFQRALELLKSWEIFKHVPRKEEKG